MLLLLLTVSVGHRTWAQSIVNYTYSTGTNGTLEDLSTGSTSIQTGRNDDVATSVVPIGFNFLFMGVNYTHISANSNGQFRLHTSAGATAIGANVSTLAASTVTFAPFSGDNETGNGIRTKVIGTAPNRKFVIEWNQFQLNFADITNAGNMQAWLEEGTGVITYMYGEIYNSSTSTVSTSIFLSSSNTATTAGSVTISATPTFSASGTLVSNTIAAGAAPIGSPLVANIGSSAQGSRRFFRWTPSTTVSGDVTTLTFSAISSSATTVNWVDNATNELGFVVTRATDASFTQNVVTTQVATTTSAGTGTAYTSAQTGLTPGTTYFYKVEALVEGRTSTGITGSQATTAATTYYWVGASGGAWGTATNWNTAANGTGASRTAATTDILVIDGAGTTAGGTMSISVDSAPTIGQLLITSNTTVSLIGLTSARTITIGGSPGNDFVVEAGSTLNLTASGTTPNFAVAIAFSATTVGNTGSIAGTINLGGSTSNTITTTGGTSTVVTVASTGIINNAIVGTGSYFVGSAATLVFANGSSYNISGGTTAVTLPLATWGATSNVTVSGLTTATSITNAAQSFGNFTYNATTSTGTMSLLATSTAVFQGNFTVSSTGTTTPGKMRLVTSGSLTIQGNLNVSGGTVEISNNSTGIVIVNGNVNISGGTFDIAFNNTPTFRVLGNFVQTGGTVINTSTTGAIEFAGTSAQNLTMLSGAHGTNTISVRVNNAAGVNLTADMSIRNLTESNGSLTGTGVLSYGASSVLTYNSTTGAQTINATEFPAVNGPASLVINNTAASPNNTVTLNAARSLGASGVLTLTSGFLVNGANTLTITNPAVGGIVGGSATSNVRGSLARTLPSGLVSGSTYSFPIGATGFNPFALVNPTTNAGAAVVVKATVSDAGTSGSATGLLSALNTNRSWLVEVTDAGGNFTGTFVRLTDTPGAANAVGFSADGGLTYNLVGGTTATVTGTDITTTAPALTNLNGYFLMGTKADPPVLSGLAVSPTGNQCTNVTRNVSITATPGAAAVTGVVINYTVNGVAQTAVSMTNTSGTSWAGTIPTVTPANATVAWSVVATDANGITATQAGTSYSDAPNTGLSLTATASQSAICDGSSTSLSVSLAGVTPSAVGTGTVVNSASSTGSAGYPAPFGNYYQGALNQMLIRASELTAAGYTAGSLTSIAFDVVTPNTAALSGFSIGIKTTALTALGSTLETGFTTVYSAASYTPSSSAGYANNKIVFNTPFVWDGTSNIVVQTCFANTGFGTNAVFNQSTTSFVSSLVYRADLTTVCSSPGAVTFSYSQRPNMRFELTPSIPSLSWSNGTTSVGSTANLTVSPTANTTYTATSTLNGCSISSNPVSITVNPLPTAPTATNSTQCGTRVPTAAVADPNGFTSPTYKWYATNVATTALQTSTSTTYTAAVASTTTFYVSVVNPTTLCESARTPVTVTVDTPQTITMTPSSGTVCQNGTIALSASSTAGYTYTWTASPEAGSGITNASPLTGASVNVTPTGTGPYTYTATGVEGSCTATNTVIVTITAAPSLVISSSSSAVCPGGPATLTAQNAVIAAGLATVGTGTGTTGATTQPTAFCNRWPSYRMQLLYTQAELSALGLIAGAINSMAFNISSLGDAATNANFTVSLASTTASSFTTTSWLTGTSAVTVYPAQTYTHTASGWQTINFSTPYNWDGVSNILVNISMDGADLTNNSQTLFTTSVQNMVLHSDFNGKTATTGTLSTSRLNVRFGGLIQTTSLGSLTYTWNDPSATTGNVLTVNPSATTAYTVAGFDSATGCTGYKTATVTVNPPPTAPTATNSSQCGAGVPTASVANSNGFASPIYRWYADNTTTTALQSGASATYTSSISTTTTFYVSVTSATAGCESARTPVTVTVNTPATISVSSSSNTICLGDFATLTASALTGTVNSYAWSPAATLSASSGSSVVATPTTATTYSVVGTDSNNCTTTAVTITINVNNYPSAVTIAQTPATLCAGGIATLTANGGTIATPPTTAVGTGATTEFNTSPYRNGANASKQQYLFTKADLNAAGITSAATISSLSFFVTSNGSPTTLTNYQIAMAHTTATLLGSTFDSTTSTVVFGPQSFTTVAGNNTHTLATPFAWNGNDNIVITICHETTSPSSSCTVRADAISGRSTGTTSFTAGSLCAATSAVTSANRPNITFGFSPVVITRVWSPLTALYTDAAATIPYTGDSRDVVYTNTSSQQTYTVTASNGSCSVSDDVTVTPNPLPSFTTSGITICKGETGSLSAVSGESNTYSWTPVGGGTTLTGVTVSVSPLATTTYNVVATSNITACQSTQQVTVTVNDPGQIISGTTERTVSPDVPTTFEVVTSGTGLTYQWQVNDGNGWVDLTDDYVDGETGNYSGTTTATLTVQNITFDFNGYLYQCIVTGGAPCVSLEPIEATLNVSSTGFLTQPANVTLCGTSTANFAVTTSGDAPFNVQWQVSTDGGASFQDIVDGPDATIVGLDFTGANADTPIGLSVTGITTAHDGYQFLCQLNFGLNSTIATLDVKTPVAVTTQPQATQSVCYTGGTTSFTAAASGDFTGVQWQYSANGTTGWANVVNGTPAGATYANATTTTLGITTTAATTSGYYRANFVGSTPCTNVASDAGQLLINTPNVAINASSTAFCLPSGSAVTLTGSGASTYTWSPVTGLSSDTGAQVLCLPSATTTYTVTGTDATGCVKTAQVTITVGSDLTATASATPTTVCSGSNSQLDVQVSQAIPAKVNEYTFTKSTTTYTEFSDGTVVAIASGGGTTDDGYTSLQNIGFQFQLAGSTFTQFSINSNGYITLGALASVSSYSVLGSAETNVIAFNNRDFNNNASSVYRYKVEGSAPNRILKIQAKNFYRYNNTNHTGNAQIWLYEGSNKIEIIYGTYATNWSTGTAVVGIKSVSTATTDILAVNSATWAAVTNASASNSSTAGITQATTNQVTSGTMFTFTPPLIAYTYSWSPSTFIEGQTNIKSPIATGVNAPIAYTVTVTNAAGCSATATTPNIVLESGPVITAQPSPLVVTKCQGEAASFSVTATGPSLTYQWRKDGQPITGNASATTATLNLTGTTPTDSGSYDVVITACAVSVTSDAVALTVYPTPTVTTTLSAATYCAGATVPTISLAGTPGGVTFDVTGGSAVGLSNQTGVTSIPSFTATAGSATITVTPKANGCTGTAVTYTITVNPLPTALSVSPSSQTICSNGTPVLLTASGGIVIATSNSLGTDTTTNTSGVVSATDYPAPYGAYYENAKQQYLIRASELTALGFTAGTSLKSLSFNVTSVGTSGVHTGYTISIGNTTQNAISTFETGLTQVFGPVNYQPVNGANKHVFTTPFVWNGTSNIVIQVCHSNDTASAGTFYTTNAVSTFSTTAFNSSLTYRVDNTDACGSTSITYTEAQRPNMVFDYDAQGSVTWTPTTGLFTDAAGTVAYTGTARATVYARPSASTNYVARVTAATGCFVESSATAITVNPAPTVTSSYACSGTSFTANAVPGSAGSYTYAWTVPAGFTNPGNVASFVSSTPGTYSVVITNTVTGCSSSSSSFTVTFGTLYQDADGDGYGNPAVSIVGCSQSGYVTNNTDCDDTIFAVNPGVTEILYNGVDDNCNGVMDEGYQITANMVNCGTTLSTLSSFIYCVSTPGVNGYRFEVTNTTTNQVQTIDRPIQYFSLTQLSSYDYATTYSVRVMVRKSSNNVWLGYYGPACLYSTPPVVAPTGGAGTTQLQTYCGETLPTISTIISTTSLAGATGYRFRVTNTTTGAVQTLTRTLHWFSLTMLSSYNYGTTYAVDVAVKTTGDYSNYGAPCFVTTPAVPTLSNYCGGAVVPTKGTLIRTTSLDKVTAYEFTVDRYNASLELVSSSVVVKSLNRFTFNDITNYAPNTTYSVRVRVFTAGSWSPYGDACEIVSPGAAKQGDTKAVDSSLFSVVAYPNPYDYQFSFRMESSSDAPVHVKVYDMIGKLIETREINAADMPVVSLGERYPSGVYNVVVTQEDNVKTLRLVKR